MREYIKKFINDIENKINNNYTFTEKDKTIFKDKLAYFQHERLIHLLVTLFYALFAIIFLIIGIITYIFLIIFLILVIFLLFYVYHYFFLENKIHYIYTLYDKIFNS